MLDLTKPIALKCGGEVVVWEEIGGVIYGKGRYSSGGAWTFCSWDSETGRNWRNFESSWDLINQPEKFKLDVWVNVYVNSVGQLSLGESFLCKSTAEVERSESSPGRFVSLIHIVREIERGQEDKE